MGQGARPLAKVSIPGVMCLAGHLIKPKFHFAVLSLQFHNYWFVAITATLFAGTSTEYSKLNFGPFFWNRSGNIVAYVLSTMVIINADFHGAFSRLFE